MTNVEAFQVGACRENYLIPEKKDYILSIKPDSPFVSIIVPTRNEEKYIGQCLESLAIQTYPRNKFEVIVVDGLSEDNTLQIVRTFSEKLSLRIVENPKIAQVFGFNLGIEKARGEYLLFIGGHSYVESDFLEKSVAIFKKVAQEEPLVAAVGGRLQFICSNRFAQLFSLVYSSRFSGASSFWYSKHPRFVNTVAFGLYKTRFIKKIGSLDEDMLSGEDFELNLRLKKEGFKIYFSPDIRSNYYVRCSLPGFLKQTLWYGAAKGLCFRKGYINPKWFIPSLFVIHQFVLLYLIILGNWGLLSTFAVPFVAYWMINVSVCIQFVKRGILTALLPATFWIFHSILGLGFLAGAFLGKTLLSGLRRIRKTAKREP